MTLIYRFRCRALPTVPEWRWLALVVALAWTTVWPATGRAETFRQWQALEMEFHAHDMNVPPMSVALDFIFTAPNGDEYVMPAFWDGGNTWKVRFTPTAPGEWTFRSIMQGTPDDGLHQQIGTLTVQPPEESTPFNRHGGFLKVSSDNRYLTYSDGTPFFWLGDTWWYCPSKLCPIETSSAPQGNSMFRSLVDKRADQGFTTAQILLGGPKSPPMNIYAPKEWSDRDLEFWKETDQYIRYAAEKGILLVIGSGWHSSFDKPGADDLRLLWRYILARVGAYPVTWLIAGEYNLNNQPERIKKIVSLGEYIKKTDPYHRAMTVHPWNFAMEGRQAWSEPWNDFIMIQGGHAAPLASKDYLQARSTDKPFLEAEARYEGIHNFNERDVRLVAYRAMQSGSLGYTYGSHGLWHPIHSHTERKEGVDKWGKPLPWWEALERPGGAQMSHLRKFYEAVEWWKLMPRPNAVAMVGSRRGDDILVSSSNDGIHVIYFPPGEVPQQKPLLKDPGSEVNYSGSWFNPRTGSYLEIQDRIERDGRFVFLPPPPSTDDWLLILRKQ